eukprot:COSAG02_NODE_259_length_26776_cov_1723.750084_19_plen_116_part_00
MVALSDLRSWAARHDQRGGPPSRPPIQQLLGGPAQLRWRPQQLPAAWHQVNALQGQLATRGQRGRKHRPEQLLARAWREERERSRDVRVEEHRRQDAPHRSGHPTTSTQALVLAP